MLKMSIVLVLSTAMCAYAAVIVYQNDPKPAQFADLEGCYLSSLDRVLPYDEPYYPKDEICVQYRCSKESNWTSYVDCGTFPGGVRVASPGCHLVSDLTKDFPDCCPTPQCD